MLYVQDKVLKLGGIYLGGQVTSVEIQEAGSVYVAQDEKGKYTKSQPVGYENAKVIVDILLEDTKTATTLEQLAEMQGLFKAYGQDKPALMGIVNEDCAARGISGVSKAATAIIMAPDTAEIQVTKISQAEGAADTGVIPKENAIGITARKSSARSVKTKLKSPARDSRDTSAGKKAAGTCLKAGGKRLGK